MDVDAASTEPNGKEALLCDMLAASLLSAGWIDGSESSLTVRGSSAAAPYLSAQWLDESVRILQRAGILSSTEDGKHSWSQKPADLLPLWQRWNLEKGQWRHAGAASAELLLLEACLRALPEILSGRIRATEVLFPQSDTTLVSAAYHADQHIDRVNASLADALSKLIQARRAADLKIMEVGAGTGATTSAVFAKLEAAGQAPSEYCFTDVSRLFLTQAMQRLGGRAQFLRTHVFDAERSPVAQELPLGGYDFVIAANVLHATSNVRTSLRNVKALLKHKGVLLLAEMSRKSLLSHLTFGLLEGWWRYEDDALRIPGSPLLEPATWVRVLREEGFENIIQPAAADMSLGHQLFVAESDGIVRLTTAIPRRSNVTGVSSRKREPDFAELESDEDLNQFVRECLADCLGVTPAEIRDHTAFLEYGMDSLIAVRLVNRINQTLGTSLRTNALFDHSSVDKLAHHIAQGRAERH